MGGLSTGSNIENLLEAILMKTRLSENGRITFAELKKKVSEAAGADKDLVVVAYSTAYGRTVFFSAETTPNMDVVKAIRASMAIPFVYTPVYGDGEGGDDDCFVDGGTTYNYPIEYFDRIGAKSLGFILSSADDYYYPEYRSTGNFWTLFPAVLQGVWDNVSTRMVNNEHRTIFIDTPSVGTLTFDMTPAQRQEAIDQGYFATRSYFEKLSNTKSL